MHNIAYYTILFILIVVVIVIVIVIVMVIASLSHVQLLQQNYSRDYGYNDIATVNMAYFY